MCHLSVAAYIVCLVCVAEYIMCLLYVAEYIMCLLCVAEYSMCFLYVAEYIVCLLCVAVIQKVDEAELVEENISRMLVSEKQTDLQENNTEYVMLIFFMM